MKMSMELVLTTQTLLSEIQIKQLKRDDIAMTYFLAMVSREKTDWPVVNGAIIGRWSMSGLRYVKHRAWKMHDELRKKQASE